MSHRNIQGGDFFLLPYTGTRRERLIKAVQPLQGHGSKDGGQWYCSNEGGHTDIKLLDGCKRVSPSLARRILKETP